MLKEHSILDRFKINLLFSIPKPVLPGVSQGVVNDNSDLPDIMFFFFHEEVVIALASEFV